MKFSPWLLSLDDIYKSRFDSDVSAEFQREIFDKIHSNSEQILLFDFIFLVG
jgi:hypothetical protein